MTTPFDYIKSINTKDAYIFNQEEEKNYNAHIVNIGLSFFTDTIFLVNEANKYNLNGQKHYDFLFYAIEPRKRYSKWFKKQEDQTRLESISEYFDISLEKAKEYMKILSDSQMTEIERIIKHKGGMK